MAKLWLQNKAYAEHQWTSAPFQDAFAQSRAPHLGLAARIDYLTQWAAHLLQALDDENSIFSQMLRTHAPQMGYTWSMLRWGFRVMLGFWDTTSFNSLIAEELPPPPWPEGRFYNRLFLFTASTVPPAAVQELFLPTLVTATVVYRPSRRHFAFFKDFLAYLYASPFAVLGAGIALLDAAHEERDALLYWMQRCEALSLSSDEQTAAQFTRMLECIEPSKRPHRIHYSHRVSAAIAQRSGALDDDALRRLALDVRAWDLTGCLSPLCVWIEGDEATARDFAKRLARMLREVERELGSMPLGIEAAAAQNLVRHDALLDAAYYEETEYTGIFVYTTDADFAPLGHANALNIYPCEDAVLALAQLAPYGQCVGSLVELPAAEQARLAAYGFNRFCEWGAMQRPPLQWRRDAIGSLAPLLRGAD